MLELIYTKLKGFDILIEDEHIATKFLCKYDPVNEKNLGRYYIPGLNMKNDGLLNQLSDIMINDLPLGLSLPQAFRSYVKVDIFFIIDGKEYCLNELIGYLTDFHRNVMQYKFEDENVLALYLPDIVLYKTVPEVIKPYIEAFEEYFESFNQMDFKVKNYYQQTKKSAFKNS